MKKQDIIKALKDAKINFEIFWSQKDKNCNNYELKLIKDKNTSLWTKLDFNMQKTELEEIITYFNKFDYHDYMRRVLHNN